MAIEERLRLSILDQLQFCLLLWRIFLGLIQTLWIPVWRLLCQRLVQAQPSMFRKIVASPLCLPVVANWNIRIWLCIKQLVFKDTTSQRIGYECTLLSKCNIVFFPPSHVFYWSTYVVEAHSRCRQPWSRGW